MTGNNLDNSMDLSPDLYWRQINGLTVDDQQDVFQLLVRIFLDKTYLINILNPQII